MALARFVKKSRSFTSLLEVNVKSPRPQPRLFTTTSASVKNSGINLTGQLNHGQSAVAKYSTRIVHREKPKDLYAILGVSPNATQQQVKDSYYKLSLQYHPDRNKGSLEAHQKFTDLTEAYSVLGQYELRKKYDKGLLHQHPGRHHTAHHTATAHARQASQFMDKDKVKFNFDEFYKAHYGDALKRQRESKRKEQEAKIRATYYTMPELTQQMLIIGVSLVVLAVGLLALPEPQGYHSNKPLKR